MSQKDKTKPFQLVGLSAIPAVFIGGIVLMVTRDFPVAGMFAGGAFVITILVLAMIVLTMSPQLPPRGENPHDS